jgi:hypothetical protein
MSREQQPMDRQRVFERNLVAGELQESYECHYIYLNRNQHYRAFNSATKHSRSVAGVFDIEYRNFANYNEDDDSA